MVATFAVLDQGTTLAWTQAYGTPSARVRAREKFRDAAFALALLVLITGVAGFVALDKPAARYAEAAAARPAL
jgi:hypothetical protein